MCPAWRRSAAIPRSRAGLRSRAAVSRPARCGWLRSGRRTLPLLRLELVTLPGNEASQRVAEKAGFRREGVLLRHLDHDGEPRDCVLYSAESNALEDAEAGTATA
jgi:hypothetical protein